MMRRFRGFLVAGMLAFSCLTATMPREAQAAPRNATDLAGAMATACSGNFFAAMNQLFGILGDINGFLASIDGVLLQANAQVNFDPMKCLPEVNFQIDASAFANCFGKVQMPSFQCNFDTGGFSTNIQSCLSANANINTNIDWNKASQCFQAQANVQVQVPDVLNAIQGLIAKLEARLDAALDLLTNQNISLANWFVNFCGTYSNGRVAVTTTRCTRRCTKTSARARR